jgi:catechol 2,3-dioxygenase-like lactoylglutathione lyase family enzyme
VIDTEGLTHIHLVVRDLQRSVAFYQEAFGMEEMFREGPTMVFLRTPGASDTLTLNQDEDQAEQAGAMGGIQHFGFRLIDKGDLDRAVATIQSLGGHVIERGQHEPGHPFAYVTDPDGYVIEL